MKTIVCYFDPISPFAWLAFQALPEALMGHSVRVVYKPILFAALLKHHGQLGPAEIPGKRDWTYRQVLWLGHRAGEPLVMPAAHPFNPLPLLRLALACATEEGAVNRYVAEQVLRHVWADGGDAVAPDRLDALRDTLADHMAARGDALADPQGDAVKQRLRANTDEALAAGAFGVPSFVLEGRLFWGLDALPMIKSCLDGEAWFSAGHWDSVTGIPAAIQRNRS